MSTSKYLHLYTDSKDAAPKLIIDASSTYVSLNSSTEFRFEKDVSIKNSATTYKNINVAFSDLDLYNTNFYQQWGAQVVVTEGNITAEAKSRADADTAEAKSRADADTAEAKSRADADTAEAKSRSDADIALGIRIDNALSDDTSNYNTLDAKISSEATTRAARDVLLTNKINTEFADLYNRMLYLESVVASLRNEAIYVAVQAVHSNV